MFRSAACINYQNIIKFLSNFLYFHFQIIQFFFNINISKIFLQSWEFFFIDNQFNYLINFAIYFIILFILHLFIFFLATVCFHSEFSKQILTCSCLEQHRLIISSSFACRFTWSCLNFYNQIFDMILSSELAITLRKSLWSHMISITTKYR